MTYKVTIRDYAVGDDEEWYWYRDGGAQFVQSGYRAQRVAPIDRHGVVPVGGDYQSAIDLEIELFHASGSTSEVENAATRLRGAFAPETGDGLVELTLELPSGEFMLRGRPRPPEIIAAGNDHGYGAARLVFELLDPLRYSSTAKSAATSVAASTGGMVTPMDTPMVTTGSGSSGDVTVTNDGTAPAPWQAFLTGPLTTPRLILGGETITVDGEIASGSTAILDSRDGSLLIDGAPYPWVTVDSVWWEIPPGSSTFSFRAAGGTGTALLTWRDASF